LSFPLRLGQVPPAGSADAWLVAAVERPLLDALAADEPSLGQDFQMLAHGRMTHAELLSDRHPAYSILYQVSV